MKIKFKLTKIELQGWGFFLEATHARHPPRGQFCHTERMIYYLLEDLIVVLRVKWAKAKESNTIEISAPLGIAFMLHCWTVAPSMPSGVDWITINKIIGIIDKKTK